MNSDKFFLDILNRLPKGLGGQPPDPEKHNLYAGLYQLSKEVAELQSNQQRLLQELQRLVARIR